VARTDQFRREEDACRATGGCRFVTFGDCYRQQRCLEKHTLKPAARPEPFIVPLFSDLEDLSSLPTPDMIPEAAATPVRMVTVIMARPPIPNMRRSSREVADQWIRLAGQEAINHAGVCKPHGCVCPNCEQYKSLRSRAVELFDKGYCPELSEAYRVAMDEVTGGVSATVWSLPTPRAPKIAKPQLDIEREAAQREGNWVADRFGGLEL
jgi:hypothetical protein